MTDEQLRQFTLRLTPEAMEKYVAVVDRLTRSGYQEARARFLAAGDVGDDIVKWPPKSRYDLAVLERKARRVLENKLKNDGVQRTHAEYQRIIAKVPREYAKNKIQLKLQNWANRYYKIDPPYEWMLDSVNEAEVKHGD